MGTEELSYTSEFDAATFWKATKRSYTAHRWEWARYALALGIGITVVAVPGFLVAHLMALDGGPRLGMACVACVGFITGILLPYSSREQAVKRASKGYCGDKYNCRLDDEAFVHSAPSGVETRVPWRIMRITVDLPEAYVVEYPRGSMVVFRKGLKESGLDEEFRIRVEAAR